MEEHRAAEDELLDFKLHPMERPEHSLRAAHRDLAVQRAWLSGKIVVGRQMNHRSQPWPVRIANSLQRAPDAILGGQVHRHALDLDRRIWGPARSKPTTL